LALHHGRPIAEEKSITNPTVKYVIFSSFRFDLMKYEAAVVAEFGNVFRQRDEAV